MALRGIKPSEIKKRLKMFVYGPPKVGKTWASLQFPKPYFIDTERGAENKRYVELLNESDGVLFQTSDYDEIVKEILSLLSTNHPYKTLVIDPLTTVYNDLIDKFSIVNGKDNTGFGRHREEANKKMKRLYNLILRLDMNVIITAHSKNEYEKGNGKEMILIGETFDCYSKFEHLFDLILGVRIIGKDRKAFVRGTRLDDSFPLHSLIDFSFEEICKRYGDEMLLKNTVPQKLSSDEQVNELKKLIQLLNVPEEIISKWLSKSDSENFYEMPSDIIQKCIDSLKGKING